MVLGTDILNLLQAANELTGKTKSKQILLLTDGGDDDQIAQTTLAMALKLDALF
jgi:hypothetical protein